jgi:xylulokinase
MAVLGIDLGTSGCKTVVVDREGRILASATAEYPLSTPKPLWSEQDPAHWWRGLVESVRAALAKVPGTVVEGIGIGGQMHGATLLDGEDRVLRPAILWNDGRCQAECDLLHRQVPSLVKETGNRALVGFTAPKLVWVRRHEPAIWKRVRKVLLPKDWLRFRLTGEYVAEMSDGAGMLLMDVARRRWSPAMLKACRIDESFLGRLIEGSEIAGAVTAVAAAELGIPAGVPVVGAASLPARPPSPSARPAWFSPPPGATAPTSRAACTLSATPSPRPGTRWGSCSRPPAACSGSATPAPPAWTSASSAPRPAPRPSAQRA